MVRLARDLNLRVTAEGVEMTCQSRFSETSAAMSGKVFSRAARFGVTKSAHFWPTNLSQQDTNRWYGWPSNGMARVWVIINSLNGFMNAMAGEQTLLAQMHELLTYLNQCGVVTFLILAVSGMLGRDLTTPVDMSYLSDNVLVLRFFEAGGRVRKALWL